jgi:hypothetical protein
MQEGLKGYGIRKEGSDRKRDKTPMNQQKEERRRTLRSDIDSAASIS